MIPSKRLIALYLTTAHVSLVTAFVLTASNPSAVAGFFYHSRMVAIVHLVTIGWIAMSILGCLYLVLPMACGVALPARRGDFIAYGLTTFGLAGMVVHFWIGEFSGMAWSAISAALGVLHVVARAAIAMRQARIQGAVKLHIYLAAINLAGAVTMGVLLGFDKMFPFLPGYVLANVFAHAHLAAIGWVCMTLLGFGYRLLPMTLPSQMPSGRSLYASAILLEVGVLGLFVSLVVRGSWVPLFAVIIVAAFLSFGGHVAWMFEHPKRPPSGRQALEFGSRHLLTSGASLLLACVCGLVLAVAAPSELSMRVALLYGVLGLVGFLAQAIVGFEASLLTTASIYGALERYGTRLKPTPRTPRAQGVIWCSWLSGVPLVAAGFYLNNGTILAAGAWTLAAGTLLASANLVMALRVVGTSRGVLSGRRYPEPAHPA